MALTVSTGFVVDDAIVVLENVTRHVEQGMPPLRGGPEGRAGSRASPSSRSALSLIAVFIPILLMGGIVGRLFREFAITLSAAILVSLVHLADHHADDVRLSDRPAKARPANAAGSPACPTEHSTG